MKCHLRCALSEELSRQLVSINLKDLSYQQLVQKCQTQDNQLRAASFNVHKTSPRFQLLVKPPKTSSLAINLPAPFKPTTPDANAMNLTHSKPTPQEKERCCTLGLCFYCGLEDHTTFTCPFKPTKAHVRTIQEALATQPTSEPTQDQGKEQFLGKVAFRDLQKVFLTLVTWHTIQNALTMNAFLFPVS